MRSVTATIPEKVLQGFNSYNTITVHTSLAHSLGTNEAIVYGALVSKFFYYHERDALTEDGFFMVCEDDLRESTTIFGKPLTRLMKNIENAGLIRQELRGMPAKRYVYIVRDEKLLMRLLNEGAKAAAENYRQTTDAHFWDIDETAANAESIDGLLSLFSERHRIYVNRPLAHSIGLDSAVAWTVIVTKYYQCRRYNSLREDGSFYVTEADFEEMCGYKRRKQKATIDRLIELGFIITFLAGAPAKRYFRIIVTPEILDKAVAEGLEASSEIYTLTNEAAERNIREKEIAEKNRIATADEIDEFIRAKMGLKNEEIRFVQNVGTRMSETDKQACTNGNIKIVQNGGTRVDETAEHTFNQKIYNHDISQSVSATTNIAVCTDHAVNDGQADKNTIENDDFEKILKERIGYEKYREHFSGSDNGGIMNTNVNSLAQVDFVIGVMLEALQAAKDKGAVPLSKYGRVVTYSELRGHFLERIEARHIEYFFEKINVQRGNIKNIRAYMLTAIYNAVDEADMLDDRYDVQGTSSYSIDLWYEMAESYDPEKIDFTRGE